MSEVTLPLGFPLVIEAMVLIADSGDSFMPLTRIAPAIQAPARYLEPFLQQMRIDGILDGLRGPDGGYRLGRPPWRITLSDVYRSGRAYRTKRATGANAWLDGHNGWPNSELGKELASALESVDTKMMTVLDGVTLNDLINSIRPNGAGLPRGRVHRATECRAQPVK